MRYHHAAKIDKLLDGIAGAVRYRDQLSRFIIVKMPDNAVDAFHRALPQAVMHIADGVAR